jgi:hypothetical protein
MGFSSFASRVLVVSVQLVGRTMLRPSTRLWRKHREQTNVNKRGNAMNWLSFFLGCASILVVEFFIGWFLWRALNDELEDENGEPLDLGSPVRSMSNEP